MSTLDFLVQQTMFFSIPLLIVALGGMFSERSGVINIALEGIMILGAFAGIFFINTFQQIIPVNEENMVLWGKIGQPVLLLAVLVSMLTGVAVSSLHAFASINLKANQIISGTAINLLAPALAIYVARTIRTVQGIPFSNQFFINKVPLLGDIPFFGPMFFRNTYITTYLGFLILVLSAFFLYKTRFGLRLRSCGEHPQAADSVGINVYAMRYTGVLLSGALAGLGGLVFVIPTSVEFNPEVAGYGFLALAVLIFGQWRPWRILFAALFFGFMKAISSSYSGIDFMRGIPIPAYVYKMIPFIATLIVLAFSSKLSQAPKSAGVPYDKGRR